MRKCAVSPQTGSGSHSKQCILYRTPPGSSATSLDVWPAADRNRCQAGSAVQCAVQCAVRCGWRPRQQVRRSPSWVGVSASSSGGGQRRTDDGQALLTRALPCRSCWYCSVESAEEGIRGKQNKREAEQEESKTRGKHLERLAEGEINLAQRRNGDKIVRDEADNWPHSETGLSARVCQGRAQLIK